jgi:hypothetical protein
MVLWISGLFRPTPYSRLEEIAGRPDQGRSRHKPHAIGPQDRADSRNDLRLPFAL